MTLSSTFSPHWSEWISKVARVWLASMVFLIPLAFCRETMYVFQVKTLLLQYGGMGLLVLIVLQTNLSHQREDRALWWRWPVWLLLFFVLWQVLKSWDSIAPTISWREMSRVFWLPIVALSVPVFVRNKKQLLSLLNVVVVTAVFVHVVAWWIYLPSIREWLMGTPDVPRETLWDVADSPIGSLLKSLFFPEEFLDVWERKSILKEQKGDAIFPMGLHSLNPGKSEAGTFGNKNFLAGYINLTAVLMIWRGVLLWCSSISISRWRNTSVKARVLLLLGLIASLLLIGLASASFFHLIQLDNRGSWLGLALAVLMVGLVSVWIYLPVRWRALGVGGVLLTTLACGGILYSLSPSRFVSIFSVTHGSNELRRLIWGSYLNAWWDDDEWPGASSRIDRVLTGFGSYTFRVVYPKVRSPRIFQIEYQQHNTETTHPHNEYLGMLCELGLVGLLLYASMVGVLLALFSQELRRGGDWRWESLKLALLMAFLSQLVHQTVSVGVRYTGLSFQFWLTLGLISWWVLRGEECSDSPPSRSPRLDWKASRAWGLLAPALLCSLAWVSMPSLSWPIQWVRSQHFFMMGQVYYASIRQYQTQWGRVNQDVQRFRKQLRDAKVSGAAPRQALSSSFQQATQLSERLQKALSFYQILANRYFEAGYRYDPAHVESLYIGANMAVQLGNRNLAFKEHAASAQYLKYALGCYQKIEKEWPYFVQLHYWKGVCWKGLGVISQDQQKSDAHDHFRRALASFDRYELQDPIYKELFLDRYFCRVRLGERERGMFELVSFLLNIEDAGEPLFRDSQRFDARYILSVISQGGLEGTSEVAQLLYERVMDHRASTCLLPFVPKTHRHIKHSFRLLREQDHAPGL